MKDFKVEFIGTKGNRNYRFFETEKQANNFYEKCNGQAIIKKYNADTFNFDVIRGIK